MLRRAGWVLIALLTLVAAGAGVAAPAVYDGLVEKPYLPGAYSQDVMSAAAALVLLVLALTAKASRPRLELIVLGLLGYLVYAYGIYTIERVYNWLYLVYMSIFATALWAVVYEAVACAGGRRR